jgi:hypothetical protein
MQGTLRRIGLVLALGMALAGLSRTVAPAVASAEGGVQFREFFGRIDSISAKKLIVDNRMGDKLSFVPAADVKVVDSREQPTKSKWNDLKKSDWVTVSWQMMDHPRKAYQVKVMPEKKEAGDDVE